MASSTSFDAVSNVGSRFHTQRINRRLDDRDNVIKEAVSVLEEKSASYFPVATSVVIDHNGSPALQSNQAAATITITVAGTNFNADKTGAKISSATINGSAMTLNTTNNTDLLAEFTGTTTALTQHSHVCFRMHSEEVLVCEIWTKVG